MQADQFLTTAFQKAFETVYQTEPAKEQIQIQKTRKEFNGDYTINVFPFLKISRSKPEDTATALGEELVKTVAEIENFEVIKGFLNLTLSNQFWANFLSETYQNNGFGQLPSTDKMVMVEYSSPNTNKPLHLGHLRNIFLGYSVAEILKLAGNEIKKTQIINDRGIHICKSMVAWLKYGNGATPESTGLKGDKLVGDYYVAFDKQYKVEIAELMKNGKTEDEAKQEAPIFIEAQEMLRAWEKGDEEAVALWEKMNAWVYAGFDVTYATMGVDFDELYYESNTYLLGKKVVDEGLEKGVFFRKEDGSVWCDLSEDGLDEKLVLRKDGTAVYMTQDIGTAIERFKNFPALSKLIYTVGNEQDYHFKVLFLILKKLGYAWAEECYHLSYGMVELPEGKMKSREGTVVDADDLMAGMIQTAKEELKERGTLDELPEEEGNQLSEIIGLGALKYFLLKVDPKKKILFNPKESIDLNGNTAPFIQYTHARIKALLRREMPTEEVNFSMEWSQKEHELIKQLYDFPLTVKESAEQHSPALLCNYLFDLVKLYNSFYQSVRIFDEDTSAKNVRLALSKITAETISTGMNVMGIQVPERM